MIRPSLKKVKFGRRFILGKSGEALPPRSYGVETEAALPEDVAVPVCRRILTLLRLQPKSEQPGFGHMSNIDPNEPEAAPQREAEAGEAAPGAIQDSEALRDLTERRQAETDRRSAERAGIEAAGTEAMASDPG